MVAIIQELEYLEYLKQFRTTLIGKIELIWKQDQIIELLNNKIKIKQ